MLVAEAQLSKWEFVSSVMPVRDAAAEETQLNGPNSDIFDFSWWFPRWYTSVVVSFFNSLKNIIVNRNDKINNDKVNNYYSDKKVWVNWVGMPYSIFHSNFCGRFLNTCMYTLKIIDGKNE